MKKILALFIIAAGVNAYSHADAYHDYEKKNKIITSKNGAFFIANDKNNTMVNLKYVVNLGKKNAYGLSVMTSLTEEARGFLNNGITSLRVYMDFGYDQDQRNEAYLMIRNYLMGGK